MPVHMFKNNFANFVKNESVIVLAQNTKDLNECFMNYCYCSMLNNYHDFDW